MSGPPTPLELDTIAARLLPGARILEAAPLAGGVSAVVIGVTVARAQGGEERIVVRQHRDVAGKKAPVERAETEFALLQVLHARGIAVPRPRLFAPPMTLVVDRVAGETTLPAHPEDALASTLSVIHGIDPSDLPRLDEFVDPMPHLREWFPALTEHPRLRAGCGAFADRPCLLHADYWPGNVLWQGEKIAAVLDWEDACVGDPLVDVACMRAELYRLIDAASAVRFTDAYAARRQIDRSRLLWWDLFMATAPLMFMDGWGLPPDELETRRVRSTQWQARALRALGLLDAQATR
jgi:aminoglycoside phosphotransferase (APT) family kinase protein